MSQRATGEFDVKLVPQPPDEGRDPAIARMTIDKQFRGDLEGTSQGQMLTAMGSVEGSAGYVATERVSGILGGRKGSFVLQHQGIMDRGKPSLRVVVVPDSGTAELTGLSGTFDIILEGKKHAYAFEYEFTTER